MFNIPDTGDVGRLYGTSNEAWRWWCYLWWWWLGGCGGGGGWWSVSTEVVKEGVSRKGDGGEGAGKG